MGDYESWNNEPPKHVAPPKVTDEWEKRETRDGVIRLLFWCAVLGGLCAAAIWWILN